MRAVLLALCSVCLTCTLVVDGRIDEYEGACADEEENVRASYGVGDRRRNVAEIAEECHGGCTGEDCVERCIGRETIGAVSLECAACFADAADCIATFCAPRCGGDLLDVGCASCACENQCSQARNACAGIVVVPCP